MNLFIDEPVPTRSRGRGIGPADPKVSTLSIASLVVAVSGFLNVVGFFAAIVMGHVALVRLRRSGERGRGLAIAALAISYTVVVVAALAFVAILVIAYVQLPAPTFD